MASNDAFAKASDDASADNNYIDIYDNDDCNDIDDHDDYNDFTSMCVSDCGVWKSVPDGQSGF